MRTSELDYELPEDLIAQAPPSDRDGARLLWLDAGACSHQQVAELPKLGPPSLLVVNDTRVVPARLRGLKPTGGKAELLLLERLTVPGSVERWQALGRASKGMRAGTTVDIGDGALRATVLARGPGGHLDVQLDAGDASVGEAVEAHGEMPLPPYIRRAPDASDRERYQTVFATHSGAVAAPTAGLHLSGRLLEGLAAAGHTLARVTLHVGLGTFAPVKVDDLSEHPMHDEAYVVPEETSAAIAAAKLEGRPVLAVGTTVVRTLEAAADEAGRVAAGPGRTALFITPPYEFRVVDRLLTNFHLPKSTLLALVMAFGGGDEVRAAYRAAVEARYRFFSYGDAMLVEARC